MKNARYTDEFKAEAIKQITERGHGVLDVSKRLGVYVAVLQLESVADFGS